MTHTGWRKPTPGLGRAEQYAQAGEGKAVPKSRAMSAVKRVGAALGLKPGEMMVLDTLAAFSQAQDWEADARAIVWPSNELLIAQTGLSLSALKRHLRRLAEAGVLAFQDSPNGKRWGRRAADGRIVEAYGFDLTPLAARTESFERLFAEIQAERGLCQRLKRQITVARRKLRALFEMGQGAAPHHCTFELMLEELPKRHVASDHLARLLEGFQTLLAEVTGSEPSKETENSAQLDPRPSDPDPHIQPTKQQESVEEDGVSVVTAACPDFTKWASDAVGQVRHWSDLCRAANHMLPLVGIKPGTWRQALDRLGKDRAASAFALIFDKTSDGTIQRPDSYLKALVERDLRGVLHLDRSLQGRLRGMP